MEMLKAKQTHSPLSHSMFGNVTIFYITVICIFQCIANKGMVDAFQCRLARPSSATAPFSHQYQRYSSKLPMANNKKTNEGEKTLWNGIVELWDEIIEVSTYGPSERKMLKAQRERQKKLEDMGMNRNLNVDLDGGEGGEDQTAWGVEMDMDDDRAWMNAFAAAKDNNSDESIDEKEPLDFDGYAMQDLLMAKWGISLDVDFQRIGKQLYCTVLPQVGFGSPLKSRHDTELDYLMHLQGVVEILHKYDNLDGFIAFVETTNKVPKRGTDSVPFRLNLSNEVIDKIMQK